MINFILGTLYLSLGVLLLIIGMFGLRLVVATKRAEKYLRRHNITDGILVKHGMVVNKETGLVHSTTSPSYYCIKKFW